MTHVKFIHSASLHWFAAWLMLCLCAASSQAGELVYVPTNPTFGGNPNNASGLMAAASAQNDYKAPVAPKTTQTALEKFTAAVQTRLLSRLTADTVDALYPTDGNPNFDTPVTVGNFTVTLKEGDNNSVIMVTTDITTGKTTEIMVGSVNE